jgi:hypothetical protein
MSTSRWHRMDVESIAERATTRYSCPICHRCVEDGPEGLRIVHRGDTSVGHRGGSIAIDHDDDPPGGAAHGESPPRLH